MSNVTLNKNALIIPSIIFNDGILSSNNGNLTWNGGELNNNSSDGITIYTTSGNYFDSSIGRQEKKIYDIVSEPIITVDKINKTIDISSKYIPDCSEWWADNYEYFENNNINIGSVINNKVYDTDGNYVCFMDTKKIDRGGYGSYFWPSHEPDGSRGLFCYAELIVFDEPNEWGEVYDYRDHACTTLTEFKSDLSSLVDGSMMFAMLSYLSGYEHEGLNFDADLSNLQSGASMFTGTYISSFKTTSLENLENGYEMFCSCHFIDTQTYNFEWAYKLPALKYGDRMFLEDVGLETFNGGSLENLVSGFCMFLATGLANINELNISKIGEDSSSYSSLSGMFYYCCLTPQALANVYNGIKVTNIDSITLGLGHFGGDDKEAYDNEFKRILNTNKTPEELFEEKFNNTEIEWQYNGPREEFLTEMGIDTYSLRRNQKLNYFLTSRFNSGNPIYTKLEEVTNNKNYYNFVSEDGNKKFFLKIYDKVSKPENYKYFNNLEEAMEYYKVVPK